MSRRASWRAGRTPSKARWAAGTAAGWPACSRPTGTGGTSRRWRGRTGPSAGGVRAPRLVRRGGRGVIEGYLDFEAGAGRGSAFVRLLDAETPAAWLFLTALQDIGGHEETFGPRRPSGV